MCAAEWLTGIEFWNARGIARLAAHRQSQPAILALEGAASPVWSANGQFLLKEWGVLDVTAGAVTTGPTRRMILQELQPLPASHALAAHGQLVHAPVSIPGAHPTHRVVCQSRSDSQAVFLIAKSRCSRPREDGD